MSRFLSHSIVWSFPIHLKEYQQQNELKEDLCKILDKNCEKYLFAEEKGDNGSNYHYDITTKFNKVQKTYDIKLKLKTLMKKYKMLEPAHFQKPALVINHLKDDEVHIRAGGYGSKEGNIYKHQGFTEEELKLGNEEYQKLKSIKDSSRKMKQIGAKYFVISVEKYIITNQIHILCERDLSKALVKMIDDGYIFDMSPRTATNLFYQMCKYYLKGNDDDWISFFENGIDIQQTKDLQADYWKAKQKYLAIMNN